MIKYLSYLSILVSFSSWAIVPVEGILLGKAQEDLQTDPLLRIFSDIYDKSKDGENKKLKLYQATYESGDTLSESCSYLEAPVYSTPWQEKQARRSIAATLQYIGIDTSIKAIGAYAHKMDVGEEQFKQLTKNLVKNYCSKNISIFSLRNIEKSLEHYYKNPLMEIIPSVTSSPFATERIKDLTEKNSARSREFDQVIKNFRAFCSWGGEVEDYRMLTPYLNNRFIMAFVIKNLAGLQEVIDEKEKKVIVSSSDSTVQVNCTDLICRKVDLKTFRSKFPLSAGSTGILTDLQKNYCYHFRYQDPSNVINKESRAWNKANELEDPIFETSQFISLMTGIPDFMNGIEVYRDIPLMVRSSIDERWTLWANKVLNTFSKDMLFEESLKVKVVPRHDPTELATGGFLINFDVTLGELDRVMQDHDKLALSFDLKLSKNYLRQLRSKWNYLQQEVDLEGQEKFREETARYINFQLKDKTKFFSQKMWNDEFSKLVADELLQQTLKYRDSFFQSYQEEVLRIPVKFSYGLFAISYLRYRSDVAAGRLKLNL